MEYDLAVWSPCTKENINKIEMLQRRAARLVCNDYSPYSSVTDMLSNLGWRSLELRRYDSRIAMFYKTVYELVAIPVPPYFEHTMVQTRHHPLAYRQVHTSVSYYYYSFFPMTIILWKHSGRGYQLISSLIQILTLSSQESARSTIHSLKAYTVFILLINPSS